MSDAAQPLEDLEDHRRNVTDLAATGEALDGVVETYTDYARRVLMTSVESAAAGVDAARTAARRLERDRSAAERAVAAREEAARAVGDLTDAHAHATAERQGLVSLPEYSAHADLVRRRDELGRAETGAGTLGGVRERAQARTTSAAGAAGAARGQLESDLAGVAGHLREVAAAARTAAAPVRLPDPPALVTEPRHDEAGGTTVDVPELDGDPTEDLGADLTAVADDLRAHRGTVRELRERAAAAEREATAADRADADAADARERAHTAAEQADVARRAARVAADEHTAAVATWRERLADHLAAVPAAEPDGAAGWLPVPATDRPDEAGDDLRRRAEELVAGARRDADDATGALAGARGRARSRAEEIAGELDELRAEHARVEAAGELPLPREGWRTDTDTDDGALFAAVVDFADDLDDAARAGLEAALEASGLLAARVSADGALRDAGGELLVTPAGGAGGLARLLRPVETPAVPADVVAGVLAAVGDGPGEAPLWVAVDGSFGAGPLRGRHAKPAAEFVGAGARAQARARRLAELTALADAAAVRLDAARSVAGALDEHAEGAAGPRPGAPADPHGGRRRRGRRGSGALRRGGRGAGAPSGRRRPRRPVVGPTTPWPGCSRTPPTRACRPTRRASRTCSGPSATRSGR